MDRELFELKSSLMSFQAHVRSFENERYTAWMSAFQAKVEFISRQLEDKLQLEKNYLQVSKENLRMQQMLDELQVRLARERRFSGLLEKTNTELTEALRAMRKQSANDTTMSTIQHDFESNLHRRATSSVELENQLKELDLENHITKIDRYTQSDPSPALHKLDLIAMLACSASVTEASLKDKDEAYDAFVQRR
mmetsp:Transcript_20253/g.37794  ORF Transcript_20253/g.37794 Transcript_20253/m.37794 type:complete len:194 (+) Transcript_20253:11534-12115(+)